MHITLYDINMFGLQDFVESYKKIFRQQLGPLESILFPLFSVFF